MPPMGFEPTISVGERPRTYALDRAATGIDQAVFGKLKLFASRDMNGATHLRPSASHSG